MADLRLLLEEAADFLEQFDQGECDITNGWCNRHHEMQLKDRAICADGHDDDDLLVRIRAALNEGKIDG